jgi:major intracellular serine protease
MARRSKNTRCSLFPYERTDVISLQEAAQQIGWNITAFDLPRAWKETQGEGVKVAVIDTGCELDHPDLVHALLPGRNLINKNALPHDDCGHGTHASGTIAAANNQIGVVGVAPLANIIPIKVLDKNGNGDLKTVTEGVYAAIDLGADILSMSLGCPQPLPALHEALKIAASKGIPTFVAAGNAGRTKDVFYPAAYEETIAVGAIDSNFNRAEFSNTGRNLDFMAPGVNILSTVPGHWYALMSGTSMASPWVVGIAALLLSACRKFHGPNCSSLKSVEDYRNKFREHVIPLKDGNAGKHFFEGYGIVDVKGFLKDFGVND